MEKGSHKSRGQGPKRWSNEIRDAVDSSGDDGAYSDSIYTIYDYGQIFANLDREEWENRRHFFLTTLTFCLNLGNILRLPREVILSQNGHYIFIYIMATALLGNAIFVFEVCLGQCSVQRFLRIFWQCPFFEGLPYSMALYCTLLSVYYSVLNVYSYLYIFPSFTYTEMDYQFCSIPKYNCSTNNAAIISSPEYIYHMKRVVFFENMDEDTDIVINWRNMGVLMFLWVCMCVVIMKGIRRIKWPFLLGGPIVCTVLLLTFILGATCKGGWYGFTQLFNFNKKDTFSMMHWINILGQIIVGYGMGLGPLIIHGCCSRFRSPAHIDCFLMTLITLVASLLSVGIVYCGVGARAIHYNTSADTILASLRENPEDLQGHLMFTLLFSQMPFIMSQICSFLFFSTLFFTGFLSLIWLTEVIILALYQVVRVSEKYKLYVNVSVCGICVLFGLVLTKRGGEYIMYVLDEYFVGTCLIPMVLMEFIAIVYCYGAFRFSEDIYYMLGFQPGLFYICLWFILPVMFLINICFILYCTIAGQYLTGTELIITILLSIIILLPVIIFAACNTFIFLKRGKVCKVFAAPDIFPEDSLMTIGELYAGSSASKRKVLFDEDTDEPRPGTSKMTEKSKSIQDKSRPE